MDFILVNVLLSISCYLFIIDIRYIDILSILIRQLTEDISIKTYITISLKKTNNKYLHINSR